MISQDQFKLAMRQVVAAEFPDELEIYDLDADAMVAELYAQGSIRQKTGHAEFAFGVEMVQGVVEMIALLCGAFTAMLGVVKLGKQTLGKPLDRERFTRDLELELVRTGIKPAKAATAARATVDALLPKAA
jgi:hypothetical protein